MSAPGGARRCPSKKPDFIAPALSKGQPCEARRLHTRSKQKQPCSPGLWPLLPAELFPTRFPLGKKGACQQFKKGLPATETKHIFYGDGLATHKCRAAGRLSLLFVILLETCCQDLNRAVKNALYFHQELVSFPMVQQGRKGRQEGRRQSGSSWHTGICSAAKGEVTKEAAGRGGEASRYCCEKQQQNKCEMCCFIVSERKLPPVSLQESPCWWQPTGTLTETARWLVSPAESLASFPK